MIGLVNQAEFRETLRFGDQRQELGHTQKPN
jgi:hypothetical protein